jgi:septum formation protein
VSSNGERRLLLASASPRRRELLGLLGVRFTVVVSRFDEGTLSLITDGEEFVRTAATKKAEEVASRREGLILGVDTDVVAPDGSILGKPTDAEDAKRMMRFLAGKTHRVYSGVTLLDSDGQANIVRRETRVVRTEVTFADMPDAAIENYVATGEPLDKAGAYGIQGAALPFVTRIDGDLSNVIGLPLWTVGEMLAAFGIPLWQRHNIATREQ